MTRLGNKVAYSTMPLSPHGANSMWNNSIVKHLNDTTNATHIARTNVISLLEAFTHGNSKADKLMLLHT